MQLEHLYSYITECKLKRLARLLTECRRQLHSVQIVALKNVTNNIEQCRR